MFEQKSFDEIDKKKFVQLICEKYFVVKKFVVKKFVVKKFVVKKSVVMKLVLFQYNIINQMRNIEQNNEFIRKYHDRINNFFIVELNYKNKTKNITFFENELI